MTQELIVNLLGVRRAGLSVAAPQLQQAGLIRYKRGHIAIVDRFGVERRIRQCYQVVKLECDRLLAYRPHLFGRGRITIIGSKRLVLGQRNQYVGVPSAVQPEGLV